MQTGAVANRITTAAHTPARPAPTSETGLVVFEDYRLRGWSLAQGGALTEAYDFAIAFNASSEIVRVRTLASNALEIKYATIGDTLTWSANTVSITSKAGYGVAIFGGGTNNLDVFYFDSTGAAIKKIASTDGGHTWGAASAVKSLSNTPTSSFPYLAAPASNILFYTDSEETGNSGTRVYSTIYTGGAWQDAVVWDLHYQNLGMGRVQTLPNGVGYPHSFGVQSLGNDNYLLVFYASKLRGGYLDGIYTVRVNNLANGQTPIWEQPQIVWANSIAQNPIASQSDTFLMGFPKIQQVGSEYWITATEIRKFGANTAEYLSVAFRDLGSGGRQWSDRMRHNTLAGSMLTYTNPAATNFGLADLLFAQVLVSANRTFLCGYDKTFLAASTQLVGVTNTTKQTGASGTLKLRSLSAEFPNNGEAVTGDIELENIGGDYTSDVNIIDGAVVTIRDGYNTTNGNESVQIVKAIAANIRRRVEHGRHLISLSYHDYMTRLSRWVADIFHEFTSGEKMMLFSFPDATAYNVLNGAFSPQGSELWSGALNTTSPVADNLAVLNIPAKILDGALEVKFKCIDTATGAYATSETPGIAFQVKGEQDYYAILYNKTAAKFTLQKANASTSGYANVTYATALDTSDTVNLKTNTYYWLRVAQWHNKIMAWYASALNPPTNLGASAGSAGGSLVNGTPYYYVIEAKDAVTAEWSHPSVEVSFTATATGKIVLTWTKSPGASDYRIYRSTTTNTYGATSLLEDSTGDVATFTDTGAATSAGTPNVTSLDLRHAWTECITYAGISTDAQNVGLIGTGILSPLSGQPEMGWWNLTGLDLYELEDRASVAYTRYFVASRVRVPSTGYLQHLKAYYLPTRYGTGAPLPSDPGLWVALCTDANGTGSAPADITNPANILYQAVVPISEIWAWLMSNPLVQAYTHIVNDPTIALAPNTYYWIAFGPAAPLDAWNGCFAYAICKNDSAVAAVNPSVVSTNVGATWASLGNLSAGASIGINYESRGIIFSQLNFCSGEGLKATEDIIKHTAAKTDMTTALADTITDAFASLDEGADATAHNWYSTKSGTWAIASGALTGYAASASTWGIIRSNSYRGTIGDTIIQCDLKFLAASQKAGFGFNLETSVDPTNCTGYFVELDNTSNAQCVNVYACVAQAIGAPTRIAQMPSIVTLPTNVPIAVEVYHQANRIYVYVNKAFVGVCSDNAQISADGYVALLVYGQNAGGAVASFDNFRVPDIQTVTDYHALQAGEDARTSLENLLQDSQIKFYARYDGALVVSRFMNRASVDTYTTTLLSADIEADGNYRVSDIEPQGEGVLARRIIASVLDAVGRFYEKLDYARTAKTDAQAYAAGAIVARAQDEQTQRLTIQHAPVWTAEREDRIAVTVNHPGGGSTALDMIIDSFSWRREQGDHAADVSGSITFRKFVS